MKKPTTKKVYKKSVDRIYLSVPIGLALLFGSIAPAQALSVDEQRTRYEKAIAAIERNDMATFSRLKSEVTDYPLYPYLDYRDFMHDINDASSKEVNAFLEKYPDLPFNGTVRARHISALATKKKWSQLVAFQQDVPRGESYQCNYYYAHSQAGDKALALSGAKSLYLSGSSVDPACDKLFDFLEDNGKLTDDLILERMLLAFDKRNSTLMRYLSKQLGSASAKRRAEDVIALYDEPQGVADFSKKSKVTAFNRHLTKISFERLARNDPEEAVKQFTRTVEGQHYNRHERQEMADFLAGLLMSTEDESLAAWRDRQLRQSVNQSLLERRVRMSLVEADWNAVGRWIAVMSEKERDQLKWRYWQGRVLLAQGKKSQANALFESILGERNFYSVAAADQLNRPINIPYQTTPLNVAVLTPFQAALARVGELLKQDKLTAAKREWHYMLQRADREQKANLAAYASEQRWYHLSVQATIAGQLWEHLEYRFPVAHRWWFEFFSKERELPLTTLLALSRQESAFYTGAVSPVGARGLMQLMPATAKETSRKLGVRYLGKRTLSDPGINIRLGSGYLRMLLDEFDQNRILAFAGYNAGPHRAKRWLEESDGNLDAVAFIEAIPFRETRGYVQNVLMYDIYYRKLLGLPLQFLTESEAKRRY